jgi:pentatricopeptide repeat protein
MCWLDIEDGFAVVAAMRELGLQPSRMALEALLDGCAAMNDSEQAQRVVREMEREGLSLNIFSMIRFIYLLISFVVNKVSATAIISSKLGNVHNMEFQLFD